MDTLVHNPSLRPEDYGAIADHLEAALSVFDQRTGMMSVTELRAKSILGVLHAEVRKLELGAFVIDSPKPGGLSRPTTG